jgi:hypothetical protein
VVHTVHVASVTKRGKCFSASFTDIRGNRRQVATKATNAHEAQEIAELLELPYQLNKAGSEAQLLFMANALNTQIYTKICELFEEINHQPTLSEKQIAELADRLRELQDLAKLGSEAARYPFAKALRVSSSFTGMPPLADLEIRAGFKVSKKRGGGGLRLQLATRLLRELNISSSLLSEEGHRRAWKQGWSSLGDAILQSHDSEDIPMHSLIRSVATLLEKRDTADLEQHPDTNESRVYWYVACCHKVNKSLAPRKAIHEVLQGAGMTKPTINRILGSWERICGRYENGFEFPISADGYNDLAKHFASEEDLKKGRLIYFKV